MVVDEMSEHTIVKKVPHGKLVRINITVKEETILSIKITGDFFLHPESTIVSIEKSLVGKNINDVAEVIKKVLQEHNATLIGCTPKDIEDMIRGLR
jgi:hypothetical protein